MSFAPPKTPKKIMCAAVATWSFGALAIEECVPHLLAECSAVDAVEKGIMKVCKRRVRYVSVRRMFCSAFCC